MAFDRVGPYPGMWDEAAEAILDKLVSMGRLAVRKARPFQQRLQSRRESDAQFSGCEW